MIPIIKPLLGEEEAEAIRQVVLSGWVTQGPRVAEFEAAFAAHVGADHACAVSSGTAALHLSLLAAGVRPGDVVATVSHSFIATANAVRHCGASTVCWTRSLSRGMTATISSSSPASRWASRRWPGGRTADGWRPSSRCTRWVFRRT